LGALTGCDEREAALWLLAALRGLILAVEQGEDEIALDYVMESMVLQFPDEVRGDFRTEWQDPAEAFRALLDGLEERGALVFVPMLGILQDNLTTADDVVMPFARISPQHPLEDLLAGHVTSVGASGAVRRWPQVLAISVETFEPAARRIGLPRKLALPDRRVPAEDGASLTDGTSPEDAASLDGGTSSKDGTSPEDAASGQGGTSCDDRGPLAWYGLASLIEVHPIEGSPFVHYTALVTDADGDGRDFIHFNDETRTARRVEEEGEDELIAGEWRMVFYLRHSLM
jgi:hypothetical protein